MRRSRRAFVGTLVLLVVGILAVQLFGPAIEDTRELTIQEFEKHWVWLGDQQP